MSPLMWLAPSPILKKNDSPSSLSPTMGPWGSCLCIYWLIQVNWVWIFVTLWLSKIMDNLSRANLFIKDTRNRTIWFWTDFVYCRKLTVRSMQRPPNWGFMIHGCHLIELQFPFSRYLNNYLLNPRLVIVMESKLTQIQANLATDWMKIQREQSRGVTQIYSSTPYSPFRRCYMVT